MNITVKALPVKDIILNLADHLEASVEKDGVEFGFNIPKKYGSGFIRGTSFRSGLGVIEYRCKFSQAMELHFELNETHPLKFIFCSKGSVLHSFQEDKEDHSISTYQNVIVSSSGHNGHVLCFKANEENHVLSLEIIREDFMHRNEYDFKDLAPQLKGLFEDIEAKKKFFYQGNYSLRSADIVEEISKKEFTGFVRSLFIEGKLLELLVIQIMQYHDDKLSGRSQILRQTEVEKIKHCVELINNNLNQNFTVEYLAKEAGTNVNKLQDGFKHLYNLTVNKYMQQAKLEAAKEMLSNSDYNISEIVSRIGLNNRSYFSKIFKEKYGVSPKYFLKSNKDTDGMEE